MSEGGGKQRSTRERRKGREREREERKEREEEVGREKWGDGAGIIIRRKYE